MMDKLSARVLVGVDEKDKAERWTATVDSWWTDPVSMEKVFAHFMPKGMDITIHTDEHNGMFLILVNTDESSMVTHVAPSFGPMGVITFQLHARVTEPTQYAILYHSKLRTAQGMVEADAWLPTMATSLYIRKMKAREDIKRDRRHGELARGGEQEDHFEDYIEWIK